MKLFIPALGSKLILSAPWTFDVYREYRNSSLLNLMLLQHDRYQWPTKVVGTFTMPAGTELTVQRIFIRHGSKDFDSVTFTAKKFDAAHQKKGVRFWVKLADANTIEFE